MPAKCSPVKDFYDYPDYLKKLIKEAGLDDNDELKKCICKMRTPLDADYCIIKDEDQKVGVFPFCSELVESGVGDNTEYPLKLTLKQAMNLYWKTKKWQFNAHASGSSCSSSTEITFTGSKITFEPFNDEVGPPPPQKNLICQNFFNCIGDYTGQTCGAGTPPCSPISDSNVVICSMFESFLPMKHKKEGSIYYFYPYFGITIGTYGACTSTMISSALECTQAAFGTKNGPDSSLTVKILNDSCFPVKLYTRIMSDKDGCAHSGSGSISKLEFTE